MKAWQFTGVNKPLALNEVPEPTPSRGDVLIKTMAAGMCHSDIGVLEIEGFVPFPMPSPITLGHEVAGVVEAVGDGVTQWKKGDRVAIALGAGPVGFARDGGYAPKITAPADTLIALPDSVSFALGAIATDAGATAYHGVVSAGEVKKDDRVGIIGYGGLGQIGAQVATLLGAHVFVAEPKENLWPSITAAGAERVVADVSDLAAEKLDVIIDFAGFGTTTAAAIRTVREGGRVVQIGLGKTEATISTADLVSNRITLIGSLSGTQDDVAGVISLFATGKIDMTTTEVGFDDIPGALERLAQGKAHGRLVALYNQ